MRRSLKHYGSECLRRITRKLDPAGESEFIAELLVDMNRILGMENGLGLAAPQAGETVSLFIMNDRDLPLEGHRIFINPIIRTEGDIVRDEEGCLSLPGIFEMVRRPGRVLLSALDENGDSFNLELEGYTARAIQHEFDHLQGVLFIDRLSHVRKRLIRKRLAEIKREYGQGGNRIL